MTDTAAAAPDERPIRVWLNNDVALGSVVTWGEALDAFAASKWSSRSLRTFRTVEERVNVLMNYRYGTFVPPSSTTPGEPSMSAEEYSAFLTAAEARMRD